MLQSRVKIVFVLFAAVGVANLMIPEPVFPSKTEEWMEQNLPTEIPGYVYRGEIRMSQINYDQLKPFGIVSKAYIGPDGRNYDYLIIAGNSKDSFHDQRVCLTSQQYKLEGLHMRNVNIPAMGGEVPATVTKLLRSDANGSAMIFYHGPYGLRPNPTAIPFDITRAKLLFRSDIDTIMYQFKVAPTSGNLEEDVKAMSAFADAMLQATETFPDGAYFVAK